MEEDYNSFRSKTGKLSKVLYGTLYGTTLQVNNLDYCPNHPQAIKKERQDGFKKENQRPKKSLSNQSFLKGHSTSDLEKNRSPQRHNP